MTTDIFDPRHYAACRRPVLEAETLPAWCYTSPAFFEREQERVFARAWQYVGRSDEVPRPAGYRAVETVGGPVLLLRGEDGSLRAVANSCRHRGARLATGAAACRRLVCPYHAWTYRMDGRLAGAPGMAESAGFDAGSEELAPLRLESWAGFLFVCYDDTTPPLAYYLGDLTERLASYRFEDMVCVRRVDYEVAANWKLIAENAMEAYHTGSVHSASLGQQNARELATAGHWDAIQVLQDSSIAVLPGQSAPFAPVDGLSDEARAGTIFTTLHPNTQFACVQDCMWSLTFRPVAADRTVVEVGQYFPTSTVARDDFAEGAALYFTRWDTGIDEDNGICEAQQAGLTSTLRRPGRFSGRERAVHRLNGWLLDQVLDEPGAARRI